jgi:hypothetical protein
VAEADAGTSGARNNISPAPRPGETASRPLVGDEVLTVLGVDPDDPMVREERQDVAAARNLIGELKRHRRAAGLSRRDVAQHAGVATGEPISVRCCGQRRRQVYVGTIGSSTSPGRRSAGRRGAGAGNGRQRRRPRPRRGDRDAATHSTTHH